MDGKRFDRSGSDRDRCWCGGGVVDVGDEFVCGSCGTVLGYRVETPNAPPADTKLDFGLPTTIPRTGRDYAGRRLGADMAERLRECNRRTQKNNRTLPAALAQISRLRDALGMTDAAGEYAAYIYRKAVSSGLVVGRVVRHCTAAAVLLACKKHGLGRTIADVMEAANISRRDVYRTYRVLCVGLGINVPVPDPASFVAKIADAAGINEATRREALAILASVDRSEIAGKDPVGLAASVLYLACIRRCEVIFRRGIADAAGVSESTITVGYRSLMGSTDK